MSVELLDVVVMGDVDGLGASGCVLCTDRLLLLLLDTGGQSVLSASLPSPAKEKKCKMRNTIRYLNFNDMKNRTILVGYYYI